MPLFSAEDLTAFLITLKLAAVTTGILLLISTPLAWWLATTRARFRGLVEALIALPLVLPPTVLGFYLLLALSPDGVIGSLTEPLGLPSLAFSFWGLVLGSVIYSLPFAVQPLQSGFLSIGHRPLEAAASLGATPWDSFLSIVLPLSKNAYLTAAVLCFAHTLGEFGVVLMIGGNIPGETHVLSIAIYDHVESIQYQNAHVLSGSLLLFSVLILLLVYRGKHQHFSVVKA